MTFTYDSKVTYYGGGAASDKISIASSDVDNHEIWLDGSHGVTYNSIDVLDGTNGTGNLVLCGDGAAQTITGGRGESTLWGGAGNVTDTLQGSSSGTNMFVYGFGEGNDLIKSNNASDVVNFYNIKLSDIDVANCAVTNSGVTVAFYNGNKLTVNTSRDINFSVEGTSWTAVHNTKEMVENK